MSLGDLYPSPHAEHGEGFAMQATTHWLRIVPGRTLMGLMAGGLRVALPDLPKDISHPGLEATVGRYRTAVVDVSSHWLRDNPAITDRYATALRDVVASKHARLDGYARHVALMGDVELFLGPAFDRVAFDVALEDGSIAHALKILKTTPPNARVAFAAAPEPGASPYDDPYFLAGNQAWIDGNRLLIEFDPEEGGRAETIAIPRGQFTDALERCWYTMMDVADRIAATAGNTIKR
ncbi:hypothetical protein KR767_14535 [Luteibacter anthropi]|uniref:hypothetical protein n=1 Tax=Luteibacter anthropi TaxID=564369 RepID=UPI002032690E|nr:hypothetical protein [Luteibacter anthropi]URX61287.1 hypothetical protein KR767_14535 [Luteibacter anthropi]